MANKKKSGAVTGKYTPTSKKSANRGVEQHYTNGWMVRDKQMISISCVTTKHTNLSNKGWFSGVYCKLINKTTGYQTEYWGTMQKSTGKVVIDDLSIVINPKAKNGGYCGTYLRSN
ncbi:hypothetical protein [Corallibacter sp.]|uniref:hypothetical protein n=1 Tax=Corallibacter sp. TaxID=2038084 RepID=UPI003A93913B